MQEPNCHVCTPWCATTERQLANRLHNMTKEPGVAPYACPRCGSTAWATTRTMVGEEKPRTFWQRLIQTIREVTR